MMKQLILHIVADLLGILHVVTPCVVLVEAGIEAVASA
jgi:hypothetical protein